MGEADGGWKLITLQLNHERIGLAAFGASAAQRFDEVLAWARATQDEAGQADRREALGADRFAEAWARLEAQKVWNWRIAWELEQGRLDPARASAAKVYSSETLIEVYRLLLDVVGEAGTVQRDSPGAVLRGQLEVDWRGCQINTFGGGVNEIQREIVAMVGIGAAACAALAPGDAAS